MKRVVRPSEEPEILATFRAENPSGRWKSKRGSEQPAFKHVQGNDAVYRLLAESQGHLCAYCEIDIERGLRGQVEHFIPEDLSDEQHNFALDFGNMLACCEGGVRADIKNGRCEPPVRETQHCGQLKDNVDPRGVLLDPREMVASPCIWSFGTDGSIVADEAACQQAGIDHAIAGETVRVLGLDRRGLRRLRAAVLEELDLEFELLVEEEQLDDAKALERVAETQLLPTEGRLPGFWSTIRNWAGEAAERVLRQHAQSIPGMATP